MGGLGRPNLPPPEDEESKRRIRSMVPDLDDMNDDGMTIMDEDSGYPMYPEQDRRDGGGEGRRFMKGTADNVHRKRDMNGEEEGEDLSSLSALPDGSGYGPAMDGDDDEGARFGKEKNEIVYAL